jgi:L-asparagine permease
MAINGSGPKFTAPMSKNGVPYGGILLTSGVGLLGIVLNAVKPSQAFEIVLHIAAVGIVFAWGTIVASQLQLYRWAKAGRLERPKFRMPFSPYSGYLTLVFLVGVVILMFFDKVQGPYLIGATVIGVPGLFGGWFLVRNRVRAAQDAAVPPAPITDPPVAA